MTFFIFSRLKPNARCASEELKKLLHLASIAKNAIENKRMTVLIMRRIRRIVRISLKLCWKCLNCQKAPAKQRSYDVASRTLENVMAQIGASEGLLRSNKTDRHS